MKTNKYLYLLSIVVAVMFISCTELDPESCDKFELEGYNCPASVDAAATLCIDGVSNAYYTYGGTKYECADKEANDCTAAENAIGVKLIEKGCSTKKAGSLDLAKLKHSEMAAKLLQEVRNKSLCN